MIGVGVCDVERIARLLARHGDRFTRACFSDEELAAVAGGARPDVRLAGRWAARIALGGALGASFTAPAASRSLRIMPGAGGAPVVELPAGLARELARRGIGGVRLSLSHERSCAVAIAVAVERRRGDGR